MVGGTVGVESSVGDEEGNGLDGKLANVSPSQSQHGINHITRGMNTLGGEGSCLRVGRH